MRIITGALVFFARNAGITHDTAPVALLPKPPPVYGVMSTMFSGSRLSQRWSEATVCTVLCVPVCMNSLPFSQYAIAVRGSSTW